MPSGASSNIGQVEAGLRDFLDSIDFAMPGEGGSLADDIVDVVVGGIAARAIDDQSGAAGVWIDNAPSTLARPSKRGKPVGVESGEMLSVEQLRGEVKIGADELTMRYGTSARAREKLGWFEAGSEGAGGEPSGAKNQPARPGLYELDDEIHGRVREAAEAAIRRHLGNG